MGISSCKPLFQSSAEHFGTRINCLEVKWQGIQGQVYDEANALVLQRQRIVELSRSKTEKIVHPPIGVLGYWCQFYKHLEKTFWTRGEMALRYFSGWSASGHCLCLSSHPRRESASIAECHHSPRAHPSTDCFTNRWTLDGGWLCTLGSSKKIVRYS